VSTGFLIFISTIDQRQILWKNHRVSPPIGGEHARVQVLQHIAIALCVVQLVGYNYCEVALTLYNITDSEVHL